MTIPRRTGAPRIVYVTPAHQFPLGVTLTYERRLGLLEWARATSAFIVEDDYDSEYRYGGQPLPALQGLDAHDCVIHRQLQQAALPVAQARLSRRPSSLVDPLVALRSAMGVHAPALDQAVLCDFITGGHLFRHVRRMRRVYAARRAALVDAVDSRLRGILELSDSEAGLQVPGRLLVPLDSQAVAAAAATNGVLLTPLSRYARRFIETDSLLLGFAAIDEREIRSGAALAGARH